MMQMRTPNEDPGLVREAPGTLTLDMGRKGTRPLQSTERDRESFVFSRPFLILDVLLHNFNGCPANGSDKIAIRPKAGQSSF